MTTTASTAVMASPAPSAYAPIASALDADFAVQLSVILRYLPLAVSLHDNDRANFYLRRLLSLLDQRFPFTPADRVTLLHTTFDLLHSASELHLQIRCIQVATALLKRPHLPPTSLTLPWRPLFTLLSTLHFPSARTFTYPATLLKQHANLLAKLIHLARRYFPATAGSEVWATLSPYTAPFDNASTRTFSLIALFTPTHQPEHGPAFLTILPQLLQYEGWYDHSPSALLPFFSLYARLSKHQLSFSLLPHLPALFHTYLQLLELDVGSQQSANPARNVQAYTWLNEKAGSALDHLSHCLAQVVVYHLHRQDSKERSALSLLAQFLHTVQTYYHPSNNGKWSNALAALLGQLGKQYAKRRGREANGTATYGKESFLDPASNDFVSVLLPVALQALFSKSGAMVSAAETWLKHVAYFHPSVVLPALLAHVYPALDDLSSPHRMLSIMQSLSQLSPILFHRHFFPQGASHLEPLLWACLPGVDAIDAMKTSLTLTFFTVVFYHIPLIDARKTQSLRPARTPHHDAPHPRVLERITSRFVDVSDAAAVEREDVAPPHPMDEGEGEGEEDVSEDDARSATFRFEDWSHAFLDSLFKVLSAADAFAKSDFLDMHSARLLGKVMRAFFACMSVDLFLSCATKVIKHVMGQQHVNATKQWGIIVAMASTIHPEVMLPKLFDPLYTRMVRTKDGVKALTPLAKSELEWSLYLASQVVKHAAGATGAHHLLPYREKVSQLYTLTCDHDERSVRKRSGKLLRNYLASLCSVYPSEWRPFDARQWSEVEQWQHWNTWCTWTPEQLGHDDAVIDPRIEWHTPTPQEMDAVDDLVTTHLSPPLTTLLRFIDSTDTTTTAPTADDSTGKEAGGDGKAGAGTGKGDGPIERAILRVANIVRGAQTVLGDIAGTSARYGEEEGQEGEDEEEQDEAKVEAAFTGARCPLVTVKRSRPLRPVKHGLTMLLSSSPSLRAALLPFLHRLSSRLLSSPVSGPTPTSLKSLTLLLRLVSLTLLSYGVNESKLTSEHYIASYSRQWMRQYRSPHRNTTRPLLIQRAYHYHLTRISDAARSQPYTTDVRTLLTDLHALSTYDFARVRQKAHRTLVSATLQFPQSIDLTLSYLATTLSSPDSSTDTVSGALAVLADPTVIALTTRRWTRLTPTVDALCKGVSQKEDRTELLLQAYFTALFPSLYPLPVTLPILPSPPPSSLPPAKAARRDDAIRRYNDANLRRYRSLISSLLSYAQSPALHWRYQLMSTAFLFVLLKPSALTSTSPSDSSASPSPALYDDVVAFFSRTLTSELAPMRHIANEALANILGMHSLSFVPTPSSTPPPPATSPLSPASSSSSLTRSNLPLSITDLDEAATLSTHFHDFLYSGWLDDPHPTTSWYTREEGQGGKGGRYILHRTPSPFFASIPPTLHPTPTPLSSQALSALSAFLASQLPSIFTSLVNHHPSLEAKVEGSSSSSTQQGAGDTISTLATTHFSPVLWPFTRIQAQSKAFDFVHVSLVRGLVEAVPAIVVDEGGVMEKEVRQLLTSTDLDRQCTAAEAIAGIVKGIKHLTVAQQRRVQAWLLPSLLSALTSAPPDSVSNWTAALRFMYSNMDPRRLAWLTRPLMLAAFGSYPSSPTSTAIDVTSPLLQYKRFHFLIPILVEQGYRASSLCAWMLDRLLADRWLYSPYKQVRSEVAWLLFLSLENQWKVRVKEGEQGTEGGVMEAVVSDATVRFLKGVLGTLNALSASLYKGKRGGGGADGAGVEGEDVTMGDEDGEEEAERAKKVEEKKAEEGKPFLETVLSTSLVSLLAGATIALSPLYQTLLPHLIQSQHVTDIECAALGRQVAKVAAWASLKGNVTTVEEHGAGGEVEVEVRKEFDVEGVVANVLDEMGALMASSAVSWQVKVSALRFLQVLVPRHSMLMTAKQVTDVEGIVVAALVHPQVEVRDAAALTLSSLLSSCLSHPASSVIGFSSSSHASTHVRRLTKHMTTLAATPYRDRMKKSDPALLAQRHGGVLGLLALVQSHPYDLPAHLPEVLRVLAGYVNDPQPVSGAVRKGFAEFLRTHKEEWEAFKERFTERQLDAVNSVQSAPTYFA